MNDANAKNIHPVKWFAYFSDKIDFNLTCNELAVAISYLFVTLLNSENVSIQWRSGKNSSKWILHEMRWIVVNWAFAEKWVHQKHSWINCIDVDLQHYYKFTGESQTVDTVEARWSQVMSSDDTEKCCHSMCVFA